MVIPYDLAEPGGVKRHATQLGDALRRLGDEVTVMGPSSAPVADDLQLQTFGGIVNLRSNGSDNRVAILTPPWRIRRWLRDRAFDVVHVHEPLCPLLSPWAALFAGAAARVATFHAFSEREEWAPRMARRLFGPVVLPRFDRGIAVSPAAARFAKLVWNRKLTIIPNGISADDFTAAPPPHRAPGEPVRLLFVGRWSDPRKGLATLLAAVALLRQRGLGVTLDVVGSGPPGVATPKLDGVQFHGPVVTEADVAAHFHACDLFVAPSTGQESFGIVLLEAMACQRAIVCSDIEGYRPVVGDHGGILVPPGEVEPMAAAIARLAGAPALRHQIGLANRARAAAYDWSALVHRVRAEYTAAIAARAGRRRASADDDAAASADQPSPQA
jgi:phosphatidyl-myo-inositol alpha-mannosyltransferase